LTTGILKLEASTAVGQQLKQKVKERRKSKEEKKYFDS